MTGETPPDNDECGKVAETKQETPSEDDWGGEEWNGYLDKVDAFFRSLSEFIESEPHPFLLQYPFQAFFACHPPPDLGGFECPPSPPALGGGQGGGAKDF